MDPFRQCLNDLAGHIIANCYPFPIRIKDIFMSGMHQLKMECKGTEKELMMYFVDCMRLNHSELEEVITFQMPTYKLGEDKVKNYIAFSAKPKHFSMNSLDFEYILVLKEKISNPGKGKGCVNIAYDNTFDKEVLITAIEEIIERQNRRLNI